MHIVQAGAHLFEFYRQDDEAVAVVAGLQKVSAGGGQQVEETKECCRDAQLVARGKVCRQRPSRLLSPF